MARPRMYKTPEQMQTVIDTYFKACDGEFVRDTDGSLLTDKHGQPVKMGAVPPTITGLALALGFTSRLALLKYEDRKEFVNTVTRAKARVELYAEQRLYDRDGTNGAKFSLANNFKGWKDSIDLSGGIKITMTDGTDDMAD